MEFYATVPVTRNLPSCPTFEFHYMETLPFPSLLLPFLGQTNDKSLDANKMKKAFKRPSNRNDGERSEQGSERRTIECEKPSSRTFRRFPSSPFPLSCLVIKHIRSTRREGKGFSPKRIRFQWQWYKAQWAERRKKSNLCICLFAPSLPPLDFQLHPLPFSAKQRRKSHYGKYFSSFLVSRTRKCANKL